MPVDRFGHPFFYPSKTTAGLTNTGPGFFYQQSDNPLNDTNFEDSNAEVNVGSNGEWHLSLGSSDSVTIARHREFITNDANSIGGCGMSFPQTVARGYSYKVDDPRDIELKMVVRVTSAASGTGFSIKGPSGHHDSPTPCCQGHGYMFSMDDLSDSPQHWRFRKEMWHVNYDDHPSGTFTHSAANFAMEGAGWRGIAFVRYNKKDGVSAGKDSVVVEGWFNPTPDSNKNNWIMLKRVEDKGGWGDGGDECGGDDDQILTWSSAQFILKGSDIEMDVKHLSLREIDPSLSFVDTPTIPPPTEEPGSPSEIQGLFKFQWDINNLRASPCAGVGVGGGGGGETGNTRFYSVYTDQGTDSDKELSNTSTFDNRTRIVMSPANSSSVFVGKTPKQVDIPLKKVGSPAATPTVRVKIYGSSGNVIYTSPTSLDPSTLTTSYVKKIFDFSTNTHTLVTGDRIGVYYDTSSSSNYVVASYHGTSYPNTDYLQYENGVYDPKTRRLVMDVWE